MNKPDKLTVAFVGPYNDDTCVATVSHVTPWSITILNQFYGKNAEEQIEKMSIDSKLIDELHKHPNEPLPPPSPDVMEKMVQGFSESLQRGHASAMGITVEEYREMMLSKGKHQDSFDSMARALSQLNVEKDETLIAKLRYEEALEAQAKEAENATLEKILRMFYDVTYLDIRDREYLGRCLGDGRVASLDALKQFLDKVKEEEMAGAREVVNGR